MSQNNLIVVNDTDPNRWNCVKFVRARVPSLPFGLWTLNDKKKIINSYESRVGAVAIMETGLPWGHVGIVCEKHGSRKTIIEANFKYGKVTQRTGKSADLNIVGYFVPDGLDKK
jgi:hypothetical protein